MNKNGKHIFGTVNSGDSLLVLGDESQGIAIVKADILEEFAKSILNIKENK